MDGGDGPLCFVDEKGRYVQIDEDGVQNACAEWSSIITIMRDIESGMVILTIDQYKKLPAAFFDLLRFYRTTRAAMRREDK